MGLGEGKAWSRGHCQEWPHLRAQHDAKIWLRPQGVLQTLAPHQCTGTQPLPHP